jgi:hypothetical protein
MLTSVVLLASSVVEAQSVNIEADDGNAALTRKVRIGWRELNLAMALRNDQLDLTNHGLTNDIAKLEGRDNDVKLATVTTYRVQQDKSALDTARMFSYVFHYCPAIVFLPRGKSFMISWMKGVLRFFDFNFFFSATRCESYCFAR